MSLLPPSTRPTKKGRPCLTLLRAVPLGVSYGKQLDRCDKRHHLFECGIERGAEPRIHPAIGPQPAAVDFGKALPGDPHQSGDLSAWVASFSLEAVGLGDRSDGSAKLLQHRAYALSLLGGPSRSSAVEHGAGLVAADDVLDAAQPLLELAKSHCDGSLLVRVEAHHGTLSNRLGVTTAMHLQQQR